MSMQPFKDYATPATAGAAPEVPSDAVSSCRRSSETMGRVAKPVARRCLPKFAVWQAKQLVIIDVIFGVFLLLIYFMYLSKTLPGLCIKGPPTAARYADSNDAQQWPISWRLVCGRSAYHSAEAIIPHSPVASAAIAAQPEQSDKCTAVGSSTAGDSIEAGAAVGWLVASLLTVAATGLRAASLLAQGLMRYFGTGFLSGDPFHLILPPLRLVALWLPLLPLPLPNISAWWRAQTPGPQLTPTGSTSSRDVQRMGGHSSPRCSSSSSSYVWWYRPCYYWQYPHIRQSVAVLQRLLPCIACALCVGRDRSVCFDAAPGIGFWQGLGKYIFQGWVASTLVLPLNIHLPFIVCEWALMYSSTMQVNLYHSSRDSGSGSSGSSNDGLSGTAWLAPYHLITSLVCVVLLPTAVLMVYHSSSRSRYNMLQNAGQRAYTAAAADDDTTAEAKAAKQQQWEEKQQQVDMSGSSSSSAAAAPGTAGYNLRSNALSSQFLADVSSSLQAAAPMAAQPVNVTSHAADPQQTISLEAFQHELPTADTHDSSSSSNNSSSGGGGRYPTVLRPQVADSLRLLLADDAAAVFEAAAAAAHVDGSASSYTYESRAASLPVSIKVHTAHSNVSLLDPVLNNTLSHQLNNTTWADGAGLLHPQMMSVCFPGCVQLIANILALKRPPTAAAAAGSSGGEGSAGVGSAAAALGVASNSSISHKDFAAALLSRLQASMSHNTPPQPTTDGKAAAAAGGTQQHPDSQAAAVAAAAPGGVPRIDVAVGSAVARTHHKPQQTPSSSSSSMSWYAPGVQVQYCDPVCLTAGREQDVTLHLLLQQKSPRSAAAAAAAGVRVLVFKHGAVVTDQEVQLTAEIRFSVPAQTPGVLQVALLPAAATAAAAGPAIKAAETADTPAGNTQAAFYAPLLLPPLLVLPEEAAQELQQHWQQATAAAMEQNSNTISSSNSEACSVAWQKSVSGIAADMAFLMPTVAAFRAAQPAAAATAAATTKGGDPAVLPVSVMEVLVHLLKHLATHGMWHTMQFLVGGTTVPSSSSSSSSSTILSPQTESTSSSSSSNGGGDYEVCSKQSSAALTPADFTPAAASSSNLLVPDVQKPSANTHAANAATQTQVVTDCLSTSVTNMGVITVSFSELLWGFRNPTLEAAYQAVAFSSTGALDVMTAVYFLAMGLGCCFAKPGQADRFWIEKLSTSQRQGLRWQGPPAAVGPALNPGSVWLSHVITMTVCLFGPVSVLLLRFRVATTLRAAATAAARAQALLQQQQPPSKIGSSSSSNGNHQGHQDTTHNNMHTLLQCQQQQAAVAAAALARASSIKHLLLVFWVLLVHVWAVLVIWGGCRLICVLPVMIIRAWAVAGWAQRLAATVGLALKAWAAQVPFSWLWPLMTLETLINISASITFGSHTWGGLLLQYVPGLIAAVAAAGGQQVWGRKQFCQRRGIEIVGGGAQSGASRSH